MSGRGGRIADLVVAAVMLLLAALVVQGTFLSGRSVIGVSAPFAFPVAIVTLLLGFAALLVLGALRRPADREGTAPQGRVGQVLAAFALTLAYAALIQPIGYHLATVAFIAVMARLGGERRWWLILLAALLLTGGIALVFGRLLHVPLPSGSLLERFR